ncbi:MAG: hypothetical protein KBH93_04020 [Anaerolineae bacterium]|nr:hypothetical protein [Anaerolineae bacterium]
MKPPVLKTLFFSVVLAFVLVALALQPPGYASAQGDQTPTLPAVMEGTPAGTPQNGGGLLIPTSTPSGGLLIPTSTPSGGLLIPTSTPAPTEPSFPPLTDAQLTAINLQPADVPADFAANQTTDTFTTESMMAGLTQAGSPELATALQQISATYGWQRSVGVNYTSCQTSVPISEIYSDVGQFSDPAAGRAFFADPQVQAFFVGLGYELTPAEQVHGWQDTRILEESTCFAQETEYWVFMEYWGLLITVSMTADAHTDPQLVWNLVNQLVGAVLAHADAQATQPFPPTPTPAAVVLQPTPTIPLLQTPAGPILPKPPTPTEAAKLATLDDIAAAMPTISDLELQSPPWALDNMTSGTFTASQVVAGLQSGGMYELANAVLSAGQQAGFVGQVIRLWSTGLDCSMAVQDLQITVALFNDSQGSVTYMNDAWMQQAWLNSGLFTSITPYRTDNNVMGQLWIGGTTFDPCGPVAYRALVVPHGRFLITVFSISNLSADFESLDDANEYVIEFTIEKLEGAGLQ